MRKNNNPKEPSETTIAIFKDIADLLTKKYNTATVEDVLPVVNELHKICRMGNKAAKRPADEVDQAAYDEAWKRLDAALYWFIRIEIDLAKAEECKVNAGKLHRMAKRIARAYLGKVEGINLDGIRVEIKEEKDGIGLRVTAPKKKGANEYHIHQKN